MTMSVRTETSSRFWKCKRNSGHRFWVDYFFTYLHPLLGADEVSRSHGSLSLLSMMKVMVWHFVGNSHKVMTALIVALPSNYCCWDLSLQFYRYSTLIEISNYKQLCQPLLKAISMVVWPVEAWFGDIWPKPKSHNWSRCSDALSDHFCGYVNLQVKGKGFSTWRLTWHWCIVVLSGVLTVATCAAAVRYIISDSIYYHAFADL
jgi:hypothetical protein